MIPVGLLHRDAQDSATSAQSIWLHARQRQEMSRELGVLWQGCTMDQDSLLFWEVWEWGLGGEAWGTQVAVAKGSPADLLLGHSGVTETKRRALKQALDIASGGTLKEAEQGSLERKGKGAVRYYQSQRALWFLDGGWSCGGDMMWPRRIATPQTSSEAG